VTSEIRSGVHEILVLLRCYAALIGGYWRFGTTCISHLQGPKQCTAWTLKMGMTGYPKTVSNYKSTLRSMLVERGSQNKQFVDKDTEETALAPDIALDTCSSDVCFAYRFAHRLKTATFLSTCSASKMPLRPKVDPRLLEWLLPVSYVFFGLSFNFLNLHLINWLVRSLCQSCWSLSRIKLCPGCTTSSWI